MNSTEGWNTADTWSYCFDGNPHNSMLCLGTVASGLKYKLNYDQFASGLFKMNEILKPHTLIVYGSSNYPCFDDLHTMGVNIITFKSKTCMYYERRKPDE